MVTVAELDALIRMRLEGEQNARRAQKALDDVEKSGSKLGDTLGKAGKIAAVGLAGIATGAAAGLAGSVKVAADFQQALANVGAATGATKDEMAAMRKEALSIGADTSKGASEAVEAMGELTRSGIAVADVVGGVGRTVVQLSEATGSSVANMATLMSDAMNVFGVEASGSAEAANVLARAAGASSITIDHMAQSLSSGGLVAQSAGLNIEQFATAIGIMGNAGLKGSDAGTSLKAMISGLTPVTDKAKAAFTDLGIQVFDASGKFLAFPEILASLSTAFSGLTEEQRASTAELIFGSDGIRAFNALVPQTTQGLADATTQWAAMTEKQREQATIAEQSAARLATFQGALEQLRGALEVVAIEVGTIFLPALTRLAQFVGENLPGAFASVRSALSSLWDNIGPEATAAGQAIVSGLETAVSWLQENGPKMATALVAAFERARSEIGPILSGIVENINAALGQIDTAAIENEVVVSFQNMAEAAKGVDFSPLVQAFQPLLAEGRAWANFVSQDFTGAMSNLGSSAQAGKAQLDAMLPSWVSLENAARVAGLAVVAAATGIVGAITTMSAGVRNALQTVIDVLNNNWGSAFQSAGAAALAMASQMPVLGTAITIARVAIELLGGAASAAAGAISSLASGIGSAASAASGAVGPIRAAVGALQDIGGAIGALGAILPGSLPPLAQGFKDTGEQASIAAGALRDASNALQDTGQFATSTLSTWARSTSALVDYASQLRVAETNLRDLNAELRQLKLAQALDPANEAIGEQIKGLTFTINVQKDLVSTLKESIAGWNAETFAVDGFVQALNTLNQAGPQALKIQEQFIKALTENDFAAGGNLAESIQKMIADATKTFTDAPELLAPIQALGDQVLGAFRAALEAPSEETINAAMGLLTNLTTAINDATVAHAEQLKAAGTLTAETFAKAFAGEESKALLGSAGVSLMEALADAMNEGGEKAIERAANLTSGMQDQLQKLPEFVRGKLGADFKTALDAFLQNPTQEALSQLRPVVQQINQTIDLIPKNMADLAPEVVSEIEAIIQAFLEMGLSAEEAGAKIEGSLKRAAESAKAASSTVKSALSPEQESKLTEHLRSRPNEVQDMGVTGPAAGQANLYALGVAFGSGASQQIASAFAAGQDMIGKHMAQEREQQLRRANQEQLLRDLSSRAGNVAGSERVNEVLTDLSMGLIDISQAIQMLMALLREGPRNVVINVDGRALAQVMAPHISGQMSANVRGMAGS